MKVKIFVAAVAVLFGGVGLVTVSFLRQSTTCDDLSGVAGAEPVDHTLFVELGGNTPPWSDAASQFVRERLADTISEHPETPAVVQVRLEVDGRTTVPRTNCLRSPLQLSAPKSDMDNYAVGTSDTRADIRTRLQRTRHDQIEVVAAAVADEVRYTSFDGVPTLTVLPIWQDASETEGPISILSPLVSTAEDCMQPAEGESPTAGDLVRDCIASGEMRTLPAELLHIENLDFLATSAGQKAAARAMMDALRTCGTTAGCT